MTNDDFYSMIRNIRANEMKKWPTVYLPDIEELPDDTRFGTYTYSDFITLETINVVYVLDGSGLLDKEAAIEFVKFKRYHSMVVWAKERPNKTSKVDEKETKQHKGSESINDIIYKLAYAQKEWGNDSKVVIQIYDSEDKIIDGCYVNRVDVNTDGTVIISGHSNKELVDKHKSIVTRRREAKDSGDFDEAYDLKLAMNKFYGKQYEKSE